MWFRSGLIVGLCVAVVSVAPRAFGADAPKVGSTKFGYVDLQRALNEVDEGRQAKSELERVLKSRQTEIESLQKQLEARKTQLEKDRLVLSGEAWQKKEEEFRQEYLTLTQKLNAYKVELSQKEGETTGAILNALRRVVQKIGQQDGYEMILETSQDVVLYSPQGADITPRVIRSYNGLPKSERRLPTQ